MWRAETIYFAVGQARAKAQQDFQKAVELSKDSEDSRLAIVVHHLTQGRPHYAEQELIAIADANESPQRLACFLLRSKLELGEHRLKPSGSWQPTALEGRERLRHHIPSRSSSPSPSSGAGTGSIVSPRKVVKRGCRHGRWHTCTWGILNLLEGQRIPGEEQLARNGQTRSCQPKASFGAGWSLYLSENSFAKAEQQAFEVLRRNPAHIQAAVLYADSFLLRDLTGGGLKRSTLHSSLNFPIVPSGPLRRLA